MTTQAEADAFTGGMQLGAEVEHKVAVAAVANALLNILGKDAGDGIIDLGAAGRWACSDGRWYRHYHREFQPLSYRDSIAGATK